MILHASPNFKNLDYHVNAAKVRYSLVLAKMLKTLIFLELDQDNSRRYLYNPPCQVYYRAETNLSDCLGNLTKLYCAENPIPVPPALWPPSIRSYSHRFAAQSVYFKLSYIFLTCVSDSIKNEETVKGKTTCTYIFAVYL